MMLDKTPNHKWIKLKQVLPPTHPFIRIKESVPMSVDKTQWLTKLSKMIPTHHSINQILERNVDKN
ncbi:hypothetical protein ACN6MT_20150 [Neobacillus niacini]|uniref:hypothetical protein n=1 Tax=Neobacillus niacini TaxID=86668 RepID=UPI003B01FB3F